mmetsp:Transcript_26737/g.70212  ORF Transcript_26737/g.70212 Transcript_26737/m.70212 type:complete len:292 (-) Transcript_26737:110-985(-)
MINEMSARREKKVSEKKVSASELAECVGAETFGTYLNHVVEPLLKQDPFLTICGAVLPYEELKQALYSIDENICAQRVTIKACGTCCICLEDFQNCSEAIKTRCGHSFHGTCLTSHMRLSGPARIRKCPMCRTPEKDMQPEGHDGDILAMFTMLWDAIQSAEKHHDRFVRVLKIKLGSIKDLETKLWSIEKVIGSGRHGSLNNQISNLLHLIQAAQFVGEVNTVGFQRILDKYKLRFPEDGSVEFFRERISRCGFNKNFEAGGQIHVLQNELLQIFAKANTFASLSFIPST